MWRDFSSDVRRNGATILVNDVPFGFASQVSGHRFSSSARDGEPAADIWRKPSDRSFQETIISIDAISDLYKSQADRNRFIDLSHLRFIHSTQFL